MEELDGAIQEISRTSDGVASEVDRAKDATREGLGAVETAMGHISKMAEAADGASEKLTRLQLACQEIAKVLGMIEVISRQTNMLALNATIEAARAGASGRGFAVVAGEVKQLAGQTARATEQIRAHIGTVTDEIGTLSAAMASSRTVIDLGNASMREAVERITSVNDGMVDISQQIAQTAAAVNEQSAAVDEVSRSLSVIHQKTERSRTNAEAVITVVGQSDKLIESELNETASRNLPDAIFELAKSDHVAWKRKLASMLMGTGTLSESELTDHHQCRLGKWYDAVKDRALRLDPAFRALEAPHEAVHKHGRDVAALFRKGDREAAREAYDKMDAVSQQVIDS